MLWEFFARPDFPRGYELASFAIAAWDRDPPLEWLDESPAPGALSYVRQEAFTPPTHRNPQQRQVRLVCCLDRRGEPGPLGLRGSVFATPARVEDVPAFARAVRLGADQAYRGLRPQGTYLAVEPVPEVPSSRDRR